MLFKSPTSEPERFFAKDPCVIRFRGRGYLYFSKQLVEETGYDRFVIGIAVSDDLENWEEVGVILPEQEAEGRGLAAPGAIVLDGMIHLFYQSYGQFPRDYICHATLTDGIHFERGSAALDVDEQSGEVAAGHIGDALAHEGNTGRAGGGHGAYAGGGGAEDHVDRGDLALGLKKHAAYLGELLRHVGRELRLGSDGVAEEVTAARADGGLAESFVALHKNFFCHCSGSFLQRYTVIAASGHICAQDAQPVQAASSVSSTG